MPSIYVEQPILSSSAIAAFLKEVGLDFAAWPQSVLPDEIIASRDEDAESYVRAEKGSAEEAEIISARNAEARLPHPVIRTQWGLIIGERMSADPKNGLDFGTYSVDVHFAKGWNNPELGFYCDACTELLLSRTSKFNRKLKGQKIDIRESMGDGLLEIAVYFEPKQGEPGEKRSRDNLLSFLLEIFEDGTLDKVIEVGTSDELEGTAATELMLGMRPDLHDRVN